MEITKRIRKCTNVFIISILLFFAVSFFQSNIKATEVLPDSSGNEAAETTDEDGVVKGNEEEKTEAEETVSDNSIIIVIDPGHGGKNTGAVIDDLIEKNLTMKTALAMKKELEKYEGVEVYLTREDDVDMGLTQRAKYAADMNADLFLCLHYNMSEPHKLFGAECFVSSYGEYYAKGMDFAKIEMELLSELGLYDRGIKVRLNSKGTDYYGIIRSSTAYEIPCVLIEHCHLDQENDAPYIDNVAWPATYGRTDATAVAKYFGLKSKVLDVDYSDYKYEKTPVPKERIKPDATAPEFCEVTDLEIDTDKGIATGKIKSNDPESKILYYAASFDNGQSFKEYYKFEPDENGEVAFEIMLQHAFKIRFCIGVFNMYGGMAKSEPLFIGTIKYAGEELKVPENANSDDALADGVNENESSEDKKKASSNSLVFWILVFVLSLPFVWVLVVNKKKKQQMEALEKKRKSAYDYEKDSEKALEKELLQMEKDRVKQLLNSQIRDKEDD